MGYSATRSSRIAKKFEEDGDKYFYRPEPEYEYTCVIPNHKNCTKPKFPLKDIREKDSEDPFPLVRKYPRQLM